MWKPYNRTWHKVNVIMILLLLYWGLVRSLASQGWASLPSLQYLCGGWFLKCPSFLPPSMFPCFPSPSPHLETDDILTFPAVLLGLELYEALGEFTHQCWDYLERDLWWIETQSSGLKEETSHYFSKERQRDSVDSPKEASLWASLLIRQSFLLSWMLTCSTHRKKCLRLLWVGS